MQPSPVLAKLATDYAAKGVKLVTLDVDQEKLIAAQFRVQAVPTVYAFYQGQPIGDLTNYRTEAQLRSVLDQLLAQLKIGDGGSAAPQADIEPLMAMGEQILAEGDAARAVTIFRQIREMAPDDPEVTGALVRALVAAGEIDEAQAILGVATARKRRQAADRPGQRGARTCGRSGGRHGGDRGEARRQSRRS